MSWWRMSTGAWRTVPGSAQRMELIREATHEVAPSLFYALLLITISFLPVFALEAQEGRLFKPLAYTKTYAMAAAALVSITLVPVLIGWLVRGRTVPEERHPLTGPLGRLYERLLRRLLRHPWWVITAVALLTLSTLYPLLRLGSEFMPPLWEMNLLYMPTTFPGISITKAREVLQQTDKILRQFPEVECVFGKIGRAETATDPAPLDMLETTILLKPREDWRPGITPDSLIAELDRALRLSGISNAWTMPVRTRIDMLSTGIRTPLGIKLSGPSLDTLEQLGTRIEALLRQLPGTLSVFAERSLRGKYLDIRIDRERAARYGLTLGDVQEVIRSALGGMSIAESVEGRERYPIVLRYPRELRDNPDALARMVLIPTPSGTAVPLGEVARFELREGAMQVKSEDAIPTLWVYIDVRGSDYGSYVRQAHELLTQHIQLPPGCTLRWSGQYEYMQRAYRRLLVIVPIALALIIVLLYLNTRSWLKVSIVLLAAPLSLIGALWLLYALGYNLSVAVWVGLIALAGLDAETGVVMLLYLELAYNEARQQGKLRTREDLQEAVLHGAARRLRPKLMTALTILVGLLPIMWSQAVGADRHEAHRRPNGWGHYHELSAEAAPLPGHLPPLAPPSTPITPRHVPVDVPPSVPQPCFPTGHRTCTRWWCIFPSHCFFWPSDSTWSPGCCAGGGLLRVTAVLYALGALSALVAFLTGRTAGDSPGPAHGGHSGRHHTCRLGRTYRLVLRHLCPDSTGAGLVAPSAGPCRLAAGAAAFAGCRRPVAAVRNRRARRRAGLCTRAGRGAGAYASSRTRLAGTGAATSAGGRTVRTPDRRGLALDARSPEPNRS